MKISPTFFRKCLKKFSPLPAAAAALVLCRPAVAQSGPRTSPAVVAAAEKDTQAGTIQKVELLGRPGALEFTQDEIGLKVKMPADMPSEYAVSL
jgi:hypothetical protein